MSHLEDYQTTKISDLFNCELIGEKLDTYNDITAQQKAVLKFIADNPDEQYIELQNTFRMEDVLVVSLVIHYGASSEEYDELRDLREKMRKD